MPTSANRQGYHGCHPTLCCPVLLQKKLETIIFSEYSLELLLLKVHRPRVKYGFQPIISEIIRFL